MYLVKRTSSTGQVEYYKYDGWTVLEPPLDLSNCVLFTFGEASKAAVSGEFSGCQFVWYGSYKR